MVHTTAGRVRGTREGDLSVFKGIPFALAPYGEHWLAAPVPARPWDGVREATAFGPRPAQVAIAPGVPEWSSAEGLECLTINVWTPDEGGSGLPVMVWIYGGAYQAGSADLGEYDGALLAAEGVVVVTFNYRVGMQGFGHVEGAPANRGLLDQVAALRWVQENIAAFGGDPGQVTIFGESAGAGSVAALMSMPMARGLFRRAIAQSVPGTFYSTAYARRVTHELLVGRSAHDCSPEELLAAARRFAARRKGVTVPFSPVVDGEVLPATPWEAFADGAGSEVELVVGFNRDEFRMFAAMAPPATERDLAEALKEFALPDADVVYRTAHPDADAVELYNVVLSDWLFRMPSALLADAHAGPTFAYELTWAPTELGACHALDVPLTFGTVNGALAGWIIRGAPEAEAMSRQFRTAWTRFARTGDPGWPAYEPVAASTHIFDVEPSDVRDPEAASRALWSERGFPLIDE
ncbi:carboxylesterase/lipase family protein [Nonomuraea africana]|uniref:Carboxylic ester hydrolase n=1 Tax=Nonomuraea africana TaxID=46171 RepID=A0ABR9KDE3_9ACTN|nr:carboxylesterase family protein [Nonomuraea africana]MBE1559572.1 para-nitrobenzyl esterase [Nonomuraea africana]